MEEIIIKHLKEGLGKDIRDIKLEKLDETHFCGKIKLNNHYTELEVIIFPVI